MPSRADHLRCPWLRLAVVEQCLFVVGAVGADLDPELAATADYPLILLGRAWLVSHPGPGRPAGSALRRPCGSLRQADVERDVGGPGRSNDRRPGVDDVARCADFAVGAGSEPRLRRCIRFSADAAKHTGAESRCTRGARGCRLT